MKLNKLLIAVSIATFALASCESEFTKDAELNVNVATGDGVSFDGQTITVKSGTPVEFHFNGDPDFLTFYSGEAGKEYKYRVHQLAGEEPLGKILQVAHEPRIVDALGAHRAVTSL